MIRILFVDDSLYRWETFESTKLIGWDITHAFNYDSAVTLLESQPQFDIVSLDHDLSWEAALGRAPANEKTGADIARYLVDNPHVRPARMVIVHSLNVIGRLNILKILQDAGIPAKIVPFKG